ncbi:SPOR domain-containing protein [Shivajiella indica]|uniref:SPOR domain-containing protein n=1 Tax=Shivajiella indica TaxID=872115 RepID=A0ABW5B7A3_9BACT
MAEEYSNKLSDQNESNYGFPFVEVTPLEDSSRKKVSIIKEPKIENTPMKAEDNPISPKESIKPAPLIKKKRSQLPLQFSLVMLILIILSVMAYFLYFYPETKEVQPIQAIVPQKIEPEKVVVEEKKPEVLVESGIEEPEVIQDKEEEVTGNEDNTIEKIEEPSPIPIKSGSINKVTGKAAFPEYYIIASSTISEKVALEEAQKLIDNKNEVWVIYPYGETSNYRLAIGKFASFNDATQALEKLKADFDASIWILKY